MDSSILTGTIIPTNSQNELYDKVLDELKKDPFMVVPAAFTGIKNTAEGTFNKVADKLNITSEHFVPRDDDLELAASSLIGCIPVVGPIMQGVFLLMVSKVKGTQKEEIITKETIENIIDIEFAKIKNQLLDTMDKQIEKTEAFQSLKESGIHLLEESLIFLKLRLLSKNVPSKNDPLLSDIRNYYDMLRINIKKLLVVFYEPKIFEKTPEYAFQVMIIYILIMNDLINHWYQYGFDPMYALGTPADDEDPATHSFREKLNLNVQRFMKTVYESSQKELKLRQQDFEHNETYDRNDDGPFEVKHSTKDMNIRLLTNVDKIFYSDPFFFPIPSTFVDVNKPNEGVQTIEIDTTIKKGPRIYRLDAKCLYSKLKGFESEPIPNDQHGNPMYSQKTNFRQVFTKVKLNNSTKCFGIIINDNAYVGIKLKERKFITIRWLVYYDSDFQGIEYSLGKKDESIEFWSSPSNILTNVENCYCSMDSVDHFHPLFFEKNNLKYGFFTSQRTSEKQEEFILKTRNLCDDDMCIASRIHFIEIIVSD
ncbi:hypothetical protein ACTA71_000118 [Dictyostelium dimigraforme]